MTGSVSVFASLLDSLMDTAASLINLFAVDYSLKPADEDHRFGHGKAEALASLAQALIIASTAIYLIYHAIERFVAPQPILHVAEAIWVIVFAIVLTLALVTFQKYVVKHTGSTAVRADSLHYVSDLFTNVATLAALFLTQFGIVQADSIFGLCIGVYIFYCAVKVGWSGVRILMDEELPDHEREIFLTCVENTDGVVGVRRMRSWRSGLQRVVQLDVEFDGSRSLVEINENIKLVLRRLSEQDANADVSINPLPVTGVTALSYEKKTSAEYQPDE
jgi:ferrous-iron efflux pump FieF